MIKICVQKNTFLSYLLIKIHLTITYNFCNVKTFNIFSKKILNFYNIIKFLVRKSLIIVISFNKYNYD